MDVSSLNTRQIDGTLDGRGRLDAELSHSSFLVEGPSGDLRNESCGVVTLGSDPLR